MWRSSYSFADVETLWKDLVTHLQMWGLNGETRFGICCGSLGDLVTHLADVETLWGRSSDSFADVETPWGDLMTHL